MSDSESSGKKSKGVAGLESLISEIADDINKAAKATPPKAPSREPTPPKALPPPREPTPAKAHTEQASTHYLEKHGSVGRQSPSKTHTDKASPTSSRPATLVSMDSLNHDERQSIESACSDQKTLYGPAAYNKCLSAKLAALKSGPRDIDLSGLSSNEKESIERSCSDAKLFGGTAEYNKCLSAKVRQLTI